MKRMHTAITAPTGIDWPAYRMGKYRRFLDIAQEQGLRFPNQPVVEQFVDAHYHLLYGRPVTFLHDDFHPGNLIDHLSREGRPQDSLYRSNSA